MRIVVIGTGYVGLTVGACLAETGHTVVCVDIDAAKIKNLRKGSIPIYEPGLEDIVRRNAAQGRLTFSTDAAETIGNAAIVFSAVGTPPDKDHRADLTMVKEVARLFGQHASDKTLFVNKSTVPVGTGTLCKEIIHEEFTKRAVPFTANIVANPEFLREGAAVADCLKPDRIIVGTESDRAGEIMRKLYQPIIEKGAVFFTTDIASAEIIKYASNAMLATKISFINEIARLCELVGADITDVERGVGLDSRIGRRFLHAGIGYGGSCFPKDVDALMHTGTDAGYDFKIISAVQEVNSQQKKQLIDKLKIVLPDLKHKKIALWGLAFKPKTDDIREAPSLTIIQTLLDAGASVSAFDPVAMLAMKKLFPKVSYARHALDAVKGADALLLLTDWDEFRGVDFVKIKELMRGSIIGDGRNIWQPDDVRKAGFTYFSIGRT